MNIQTEPTRIKLKVRTADEQAFRKVTNITKALADLETP